jgi:hypothetical protein
MLKQEKQANLEQELTETMELLKESKRLLPIASQQEVKAAQIHQEGKTPDLLVLYRR